MGLNQSKLKTEDNEVINVGKELSPLEKVELVIKKHIESEKFSPNSLLSLNDMGLSDEDMTKIKIPNIISDIDLSSNNLTKIPQLYDEISSLNLDSNKITQIDKLPKRIKYLSLNDNIIEEIPDLENYYKMIDLYISNNKISKVGKLPKNLEILYIENNLIETLDIQNIPKSLHIIDLTNNKIEHLKTIPKNIQYISLNKNPIFNENVYKLNEKNIEKYQFEDNEFMTLTLPKGTVLFRSSDSLDEGFKDTFIGFFKNGKYIISPEHETYFFPHPFNINYGSITIIYVLTNDVKIILGLSPAKDKSKSEINKKYGQKCDDKKYKSQIKNIWNPLCIKDKFVETYPNILGWIAVDSYGFGLKHQENNNVLKYHKYISFYENEMGVQDRPEITIHPFRKRRLQDVVFDAKNFNVDDVLNNMDEYNYKPILVIEDNRDFKVYKQYIDKLLSKKGYTDESGTYHMIRNEDGMYMIKEFMATK